LSRFTVVDTPISELRVIERKLIGDERGSLTRLFCADELKMAGWTTPVAQINHTITRQKGVVRGIHFQHQPHTEAKLVSCIKGEVWDVAVDLRQGSQTFLQWYGQILSEDNLKAFVIPEGFAHGFQTLSDNCELIYLHSSQYELTAEAGLHPQDSRLAIDWVLPITAMSLRDSNHPKLSKKFLGIEI